VDLATGLFLLEHTDLVLPGRLPLALSRAYNPLDPFGKIAGFELGLGPGWALSVDIVLLELSASLRRLILPGNARVDFPKQPDGTFANTTSPRFAGAVLTHSGSTHTLTRDQFGGVTQVTEPTGRALTFTLDSATGRITAVTDPLGRTVRYGYRGGLLTSVTDPAGGLTTYTYDPQNRLLTLTDPQGHPRTFTYDPTFNKVTALTDPLSNRT
jgi:YD repeat-containing protein